MASGSSDDAWLRSFLIQQFVLQSDSIKYVEAELLWTAGLIERVESLAGPELHFVEGMTLEEARRALRVEAALKGKK